MKVAVSNRALRAASCTKIKRFYRDVALKWAEDNRTIAAACLSIPRDEDDSSDAVGCVDEKDTAIVTESQGPQSIPRNFNEYWLKRRWSFQSVRRPEDLVLGKSLSTHVLSAPLTLATQLCDVVTVRSPFRCCCLGARAEALLPVSYWREVLVVLGWRASPHSALQLELDFLGPDVVPRPDPVTLRHQGSQLSLRWLHAGKFHDYVAGKRPESPERAKLYDAFALFNPGLGHRNLRDDWRPTVDVLLSLHRPMILTAHSALDAEREALHLYDAFGVSTTYTENPFASRITYEDPFDSRHIVRPNHFVAIMQAR